MWILARRGGPGGCEGVRSLPVVTGETDQWVSLPGRIPMLSNRIGSSERSWHVVEQHDDVAG